MAKIWTKREEDFLKKHYRKMSGEELAGKFDVSPNAIRKKEKRLGLVREHPHLKKKKKSLPSPSKKWTEEEERYLQEHYLEELNIELAKRFRTTLGSVEKKLWRMGLKRRAKGVDISLPKEERKRKIEKFSREKHRSGEEKEIDQQRSRAIKEFEIAIQLYYARKYQLAKNAFGKLVTDFTDVHDLVYKAKQYIKFCLDKK